MPTLHIRVRAKEPAAGVASPAGAQTITNAKQGPCLIFNATLPAQHLNVGRLILSSTNIQTKYAATTLTNGVLTNLDAPSNSGYFVQMPWLIAGTTGGNSPMPPDSVYVCEGPFAKQPGAGGAQWFYATNNESPALEYGVNHNTIPPNFQIVLYPSDFTEADSVTLLDQLNYIEINLYFSYL